jgi:polysaccharide export outer membrane protein
MQKQQVDFQEKRYMNPFLGWPDFSYRRPRILMTAIVAVLTLGLEGAAQTQLAIAVQPAGGKDTKGVVSGPQEQAPQQPEYIVGEGDVLHINVWKETEISQNVTVRPDGNISLPLVNEIAVAGLTPRQIQQLVTGKLKTVLTNPQVTVTVVEVRSKMVYITGEVTKPGAYSVASPLNVLQLIARAGGLSEFANRKNIYILRGGDKKNRLHFNYKEVVKGKKSEQNIILLPGDTIVVP